MHGYRADGLVELGTFESDGSDGGDDANDEGDGRGDVGTAGGDVHCAAEAAIERDAHIGRPCTNHMEIIADKAAAGAMVVFTAMRPMLALPARVEPALSRTSQTTG